jgi:D-alanyl-D-alanine carboxypeptidase/D-alanyl-D-alanine-endopeptidase (penicillin-binding protein 4)
VARLHQAVLETTRLPGVSRASWGVLVYSLDEDETLVSLNPRQLFVPASALKLVSVASAADAVGWDYRFETMLLGTGPVEDGALRGDLVVVGSGDPSIGTMEPDDLAAFVAALREAGVRRIEGRVIGDDDAVEEPRPQLAWAWDDLGYATGALFGALNLDENRTAVRVTPGPAEGTPSRIEFAEGAATRTVFNRAVTGAAGSERLLWPEQRPGEPFLTIGGTIPAGSPPAEVRIAVGNPTLWFAAALRTRIVAAGIEVTGQAADVDDVAQPPDRARAVVLYTHRSPTLAENARPLLKDSINVYGEALMRLNAAPDALPTNDAALEGLAARLAAWGIAPDGHQIVDGSGLSRRNAVSPEALLGALRRMWSPDADSPFVSSLPVAGVDGSLAGRMRNTAAHGRVLAKTGTMSNIRSLAGYVRTTGGENLAFVIFVNNFEGDGAMATAAIDAIATRLASFAR